MRLSSVLHYISLSAMFTGCNKICSLINQGMLEILRRARLSYLLQCYILVALLTQERSVQFCSLKFNRMHSQVDETMTFICISCFLCFQGCMYVCICSQACNHLAFLPKPFNIWYVISILSFHRWLELHWRYENVITRLAHSLNSEHLKLNVSGFV